MFGGGCSNNTLEGRMDYCTFGSFCNHIVLPEYDAMFYCRFGNDCRYIEFSNTDSNFNHIEFDDGCKYLKIVPEELDNINNYHFTRSVNGIAYNSLLEITVEEDRDYETKVAKNSNGEIKMYCEADLVS